jgi:hypothetical protein
MQRAGDADLCKDLREELRRALVQSFEIELEYVTKERDDARAKLAESSAQWQREAAALRSDAARARSEAAAAVTALEAAVKQHADDSERAAERERAWESERERERAREVSEKSRQPSTVAVSVRQGSIASVGATTLAADEEFAMADADHDGACCRAAARVIRCGAVTQCTRDERSVSVRVRAGKVSRSEWRAWANQKKEMMQRFNAERESLVADNRRLRMALEPKGRDLDAKLRLMDEERARLANDLAVAQSGRRLVEQELIGVTRKWEEDGRAWASERQRLTDQVSALASRAAPPADSVPYLALKTEVQRLTSERDVILKSWKSESDRLVLTALEEKQAWMAEREALTRKVRVCARCRVCVRCRVCACCCCCVCVCACVCARAPRSRGLVPVASCVTVRRAPTSHCRGQVGRGERVGRVL